MWKFILGVLFGAGSWMYYEKGAGDYMWASGELFTVSDIYDITCAHSSTGHNEDFWKARQKEISASNDLDRMESLEAQAINQAVFACDYIGDEVLGIAKKRVAEAGHQMHAWW